MARWTALRMGDRVGAYAGATPRRAHKGDRRGECDLRVVFEVGAAFAGNVDWLPGARERATALASDTRRTAHGVFFAAVSFVADALSRAAVEPTWSAERVDELVRAAAAAGRADVAIARLEIGSRALRDPHIHEMPPMLAIEAELRLLHALAGATAVALWVDSAERENGPLFAVGSAGDGRLAAAAEGVFRKPSARDVDADVLAMPVLRWQRPAAALVLRASRRRRATARVLANEAASALAVTLERDALLARGNAHARSLVEASERRVARMAFDVHDGPIQGVVALAADLRHLHSQLADLIPGRRARALAAGRLDDAHARLAAVEAELREVTQTLAPPTIAQRPLEQALADQLSAIRERYALETTLAVRGDVSALTASQRVALLRIAEEALSNAREHGNATEVGVSVRVERNGVHLEIRDNGNGFEVEQTSVEAARRGRLGLVGMSERVRLLGGRFEIDSRPGGPTVVLASFPPWRPAIGVDNDGADALSGLRPVARASTSSRLLTSA